MSNSVILVAGEGRNVGKTTLICEIIQELSSTEKITAIKISGHQHATTARQRLIYSEKNLLIFEETDTESGKDSARYINAGAKVSLFVLTDQNAMPGFVNWMKKNINGRIVCESATLGNFVEPDLAILVKSDHPVKHVEWNFAFQTTRLENKQFKPAVSVLLKGII